MSDEAIRYFEDIRYQSTFGVEFNDVKWRLFSSEVRFERSGIRDTVWDPTQTANMIFYVAEGLVRFYYLNDDATESDRIFAKGGTFVRPVTAVSLGLSYGCQALSPSVVMTAPYESLWAKFEGSLAFHRFRRAVSRFSCQCTSISHYKLPWNVCRFILKTQDSNSRVILTGR